ncbi:uncharacterized protein LOC119437689 [Dermacentor silvarum]|uniref:uncharacterized protein LOC119437689 n=1 Tax=Dermacentor silvarum TaxID=543639 RepID=UPI00189AA11C|nr:uncharacterized protein LOC119437689 [Dermacentor silvarum]
MLAKVTQERRQQDYDWLRPLSYSDTAVILMRFSIDSPNSLESNLESGRLEVRHFFPSVPTIFGGTEGPVHAVGARQGESGVAGGPRPVAASVVPFCASAFTHPTPWRTTRSRAGLRYATSAPACLPSLRGPKDPYTLSELAKENQGWQEDHDPLRPVSYPSVLQHSLTRLPGEPPRVGQA